MTIEAQVCITIWSFAAVLAFWLIVRTSIGWSEEFWDAAD